MFIFFFPTANESLMLGNLEKVLAEKLNFKLRIFRFIENYYFSYRVSKYLALRIHDIKAGTVVSVHL